MLHRCISIHEVICIWRTPEVISDPRVLKSWQRLLESNLKDYLTKKYPHEMNVYMRFRNSTGPQCVFCKKSAKFIFQQEAVKNKSFLTDFKENSWNEYK